MKTIKSLNDTIDSYKKLSNEQAKTIEQKDSKIKKLEEEKSNLKTIIKEKDELNQSLRTDYLENEQKTNEINRLRNSNSYLSSLNKDLEEEVASLKAQLPWWKKRKKKMKLPSYKIHWWESPEKWRDVRIGVGLAVFIAFVLQVWWMSGQI